MADSAGNADERLIVMLEARISEFEKRMAAAERRGTRTYTGLQRGSARATAAMEADATRAAGRVNQALASVSGRVGVFGKAFLGGLGAGLIGAALGGVSADIRGLIGEMADLADVADRIGVDVESYQGLQQGLKLAGVDAEEAAGALQAFAARLGDAASGEGELAKTMAAAGIALTDKTGAMRDTLDILRDYADVVKGTPDAAARMALVTEAFGKGGKAMVLAMAEGGAGIDGMIAKAREGGAVIDADMIRKAAELDDKFDQVGARISAVFKSGIVSAAEFFGFVKTGRENMPYSDEQTRKAFGDDLADALAAVPEVSNQARGEIESLVAEYAALAEEARRLVPALSDASNMMAGLGNQDAAAALSALVIKVQDAAAGFDGSTASGEQFRDKLNEVLQEVGKTVAGFDDLDRARLDGVSGAVQGLLGWVNQLPGAIAAAAAGIASLEGVPLPNAGAGGMEADARGRVINPVSSLAPQESDRPRHAPPMLGEGGVSSGSGRSSGGGGGGGGGSGGRVEALLRDLQTEREAVTAWYGESLALLNSATEAQLAAVGGRHGALERLETEHQERLRGIRDEAQGGALANAETFFGALATVTAEGGGRMAAASRAFAAVEAGINVLRAQGQVLADPKLSFMQKLPAMAAIGAAGMRLVSALGGGGSRVSSVAGSAGSSSGAAAGVAAGKEQSPLFLTLKGLDPATLYSGQQVIDLATALQKEFGKRGLKMEFSN